MSHNPCGEIQRALIKAVDEETGNSAIGGNKVPRMKERSIMPNAARRCGKIGTGKYLLNLVILSFPGSFNGLLGLRIKPLQGE